MKNKLVAILVTGVLSCSILAGCGSGSDASSASASSSSYTEDASSYADSSSYEDVSSDSVASASASVDTSSTSSDGTFSLGDVTADMIQTGLYAKDDNGNELVFALFQGPDGNNYVALITVDTDGTGDVICGQYTATQKDSGTDGITWTVLDGTDVYTGNSFSIGCVEGDDGSAAFYDQNGTTYTAEYLDADQTITYFGTAVGLLAANGQ
ncbi:MAG: hypothetical protein ACI4ET_06070 [Bilifractor sp.]